MQNLKKIYIGNLNPKTSEKDLKSIFEDLGEIKRLIIKEGFAFIEYEHPSSAKIAIQKYNGYNLIGHKISVEYAKEKKDKITDNLEVKCFRCGCIGHMSKECPDRIKYRRNNNTSRDRSPIHENRRKYNEDNYEDSYKLLRISLNKRKKRFENRRKSPRRSFNVSISDDEEQDESFSKSRSRSRSENEEKENDILM